MKIKIQRLDDRARIPQQSREGDAAWDLIAVTRQIDAKYVEYGTGLAIAIPEDHVGLLFPRSSVSNYDLDLANCVGVIDSNYRGEVKFRFKPQIPVKQWMDDTSGDPIQDKTFDQLLTLYSVGEKIGQLIVIPRPYLEFEVVEKLSETNRGANGYGSSGK